jgi:hypothetical protein
MRCDDRIYGSLFNYIDLYIDLEKRVRVDHPLRVIRQIANAALKLLSESVPPERLMHALLLQGFIQSSRSGNWSSCFAGLGIEDAVWTPRASQRADRLLDGEVVGNFLPAVLSQDKVKRLLSSDHFSVDGTLLEAWASPEELPRKGCLGRAAGPGAQHRTRLPRRAPEE